MTEALLLLVAAFLLTAHQCAGRAVDSGRGNEYSFLAKLYGDVGRGKNSSCQQLPTLVLIELLGAAFNPRYMSIEEPPIADDGDDGTMAGTGEQRAGMASSAKRNSEPFLPFYVDDKYRPEPSNKPAWEVNHVLEAIPYSAPGAARTRRDLFNAVLHDMVEQATRTDAETETSPSPSRGKRSYDGKSRARKVTGGSPRPWECESKIRWTDLGPDYFPRFLRSVECTRQNCWYGHYTCQPRSFLVKILHRRTGQCVQSDRLRNQLDVDDVPGGLCELWVWEDRPVNFCCDCAPAF
ncbi:protein trunk [Anopheles bellator]|uniref:protein trunk n=1 Tax=Anopheles bellator TaxID=139047 RepID=UPI002649753B|nr:protein trunk [Anopheles bellator]